ncbi:helix-turn-helix domain-containing protein [Streptomyces incanus]
MIGNHLAQHGELSLLAIGLGTRLQSLPKGAPADIKTLTARFPEGVARIAVALCELEAHGYLRRERVRTPAGRIVTRTTSCNQPAAPAIAPRNSPRPPPTVRRCRNRSGRSGRRRARAGRARSTGPAGSGSPASRKPLPDVPRPAYPAPALLQAATDLLADLRRHGSHLLLSAADTAHLAPGVAAWLERDVTPTAVRHALTTDLPPEGVRRPPGTPPHRPAPAPAPFRAPAEDPPAHYGMRNCDGCERGFRAPESEARCRDCRTNPQEAA